MDRTKSKGLTRFEVMIGCVCLFLVGFFLVFALQRYYAKKDTLTQLAPTKTTPAKTEPVKTEPATKVESEGTKDSKETNEEQPRVVAADVEERAVKIVAKKGDDWFATYYCDLVFGVNRKLGKLVCVDERVVYRNSLEEEARISFYTDERGVATPYKFTYDSAWKDYDCDKKENKNLCDQVADKLKQFGEIMKWDREVPLIIEGLKIIDKPEEHVD